MSSQGIIGPFFFEDNDGNCQSVTCERYIQMCLRRRGQDIANHWLARNFGDRVISLKTNFVWAPYSPDLNPLDFFLWGHLKDVVYRDVPLSLQELKDSITQHIHRINNDKDLCNRVILNFQKRIRCFLQKGGGQLEHILWNWKWNLMFLMVLYVSRYVILDAVTFLSVKLLYDGSKPLCQSSTHWKLKC